MATNVYDREEKIFFNPDKPYIRYGWYISTSSDEISIDGFLSKEKKYAYINLVRKALSFAPGLDIDELAALAFTHVIGHEAEFARELASAEIGLEEAHKVWPLICDIATVAYEKDSNEEDKS